MLGIECIEPKINRLRDACSDRDSYAIYPDDTLEICLETAKVVGPLIFVDPKASVFDECVTTRSEDLVGSTG